MSLLDYFPKGRIRWRDLPLWRKLVLVLCAVSFFLLGGNGYQHIRIYVQNPSSPVTENGQIYSLRVMHGSVRYVTIKELQSFRSSEDRATLVGLPIIVGFLTLLTAGKSKKHN